MTDRRPGVRRAIRTGVLSFGLLLPAIGQSIEVDANVSAAVVYSDNINLAPEGQEDGDVVGQLTPAIRVTGSGARYDAWLDYQLQLFYYLDSDDSTGVYSNGRTGLDLELIDDHFFLDSRASIDQVIVDPEGRVSSTNLPINANRSDAVTLETTPRWEQEIFGAELVASYKLGTIDYDEEDIQDLDYRYTDVVLTTPERERGLEMRAEYEHRLYDYEFSEELKRALGRVYVYWNLGGGWAPFASWGRESDIDDRTDASLTENIWSAGLRRTTPRTRFEASAGERSFGSTWRVFAERQYGADSGDVISLSYTEEPRTTEDISLVAPVPEDPLLPVFPPDVTPFGVDTIFVEKRGELRVARSLARSRITLLGFYEEDERTRRSTGDQEPVTNEQVGATLTYDYDIGSRTRFRSQLLYAQREFGSTSTEPEDDDHIFWIRLGLNYRLGLYTNLYFWVSHEEQQGSRIASREHEENQVGVSVSRSLF